MDLPLTEKGNRHVVVTQDLFTKWPMVFPVPDQKATTIAKLIAEELIPIFGVPEDRGTNLLSKLVLDLCQLLGIFKLNTTAHHPQCDGAVERFNRTLKTMLRLFVRSIRIPHTLLVTALEANSDIPKMEVVVERLLHEERKQKDRGDSEQTHPKAMTVTRSKEKLGHIKRDCRALKQKQTPRNKESQQKANKADAGDQRKDDKGDDAIVVCQALQAGPTGNWIVDSRATCHMCSNKKLFVDLQPLKKPMEVSLGDGHTLEAIGRGVVPLKMKLPNSSPRRCNLQDVLYVPALLYNLISVARAAENGKVT